MCADELDDLRAYADRNRASYPVVEAFPFDALSSLERRGAPLPADAISILVPLLALAHRFRDADLGYEGHDLKRDAIVARVLGLCPHDAAVEVQLASFLASATFERHYAAPGSPDIDKYDRDLTVEDAQNLLALAAIGALARYPTCTRQTLGVIASARLHRDREVAAIARRIVGTKRLIETPITRWFDHLRALPYDRWIPRLMNPDRMADQCAKTDWTLHVIPFPVVHPGLLRNGAKPIESLLGISSEDLESCVYDPAFEAMAGTPALRARLAALNVTDEAAASRGTHRGWLLAQLATHRIPPESMCPIVVPVPPPSLVQDTRAAFVGKVERAQKLVGLQPHEIILRGEATNLQRAFDALYWATVEALEALA